MISIDSAGFAKYSRLPEKWRRAPKRWGHPLHSMCSYFAMFPPQVAHVIIRWLTDAGDTVYDPFAGRGTVPMEACRLGRIGYGSDANPLAVTLTGAKVDPPTNAALSKRIADLRQNCRDVSPEAAPEDIRMLYDPKVLSQLLWLRDELNTRDRTDRFIMGTLLGLMHANYKPGSAVRGLSVSMPNTFSMSPNYVREFIRKNDLKAPKIDVFDLLAKKIERMELPVARSSRGRGWFHDIREPLPTWLSDKQPKLIFTSPPYLQVIKYGKFNWIRLWMLKKEPKEVDQTLVATSSRSRYFEFIGDVLRNLKPALHPEGYLCLVVGDVKHKESGDVSVLARDIWTNVAGPAGWKLEGMINDHYPTSQKVSRIWGSNRGHATKTDRILILRKGGALTQLPAVERIRWTPANSWAIS